MVTLLPRQRMQRCGEVCHSVFALSVFAPRLRGRGCFDQHLILPACCHPLPPLHTLEPHYIRPTHQIVFLRQGVGAAGRAAQAWVEHAPPVFAVTGVAAQVDAQGLIPPGGQDAGGIAGGIKVHFHQLYRNGGKDPPPCQHGPGRQLQRGQVLCRPAQGGRLVLCGAVGIGVGKNSIPHGELGGLVGRGIAVGPDVEAQGVGTEEGPGVQLCLPPAQSSRQGAQEQRKGKHGAPQCHLTAGERAGKEWQHKKQAPFLEMITRELACLTHFILILDFCSEA